jgi:hypothetical protein
MMCRHCREISGRQIANSALRQSSGGQEAHWVSGDSIFWCGRDISDRVSKSEKGLQSMTGHHSIAAMMKTKILAWSLLCFTCTGAFAQENAKKGEWKSLFDGKSLAGWTDGAGKEVSGGWQVVDGTIHRKDKGGDIFTKDDYYNFELEFEWKVAKGANSGLKYRFTSYHGKDIGCEYQVLDDANHSNGTNPKQTTGSLYDVIAPDAEAKELKPVGEWNKSKIVAKEGKVQHWLNGKKILEVDMESAEWTAELEKSKFKDAPTFGQKSGRIMLQDHGDEAWFRNLRIKLL